MIAQIFTTIGTVMTQFVGILGNGFAGLVSLFYDGTGLTDIGTLSLIAGGVTLIWGGFMFVKNLIRVKVR